MHITDPTRDRDALRDLTESQEHYAEYLRLGELAGAATVSTRAYVRRRASERAPLGLVFASTRG